MKAHAVAAIDLLRHGDVVGGARYRGITDDPLTPSGWEQMWTAVDGQGPWMRIVSSPLQRCAAFSRALAQTLTLPLHLDTRLREMDFGAWENRTSDELAKTNAAALTDFWRDPWNHPPPGAESLAELQTRVLAAWHDIVTQNTPTLVITHGGPMRLLICHETGHPVTQLLDIDVPHATLRRFTPLPRERVA